MFKIQKHKTIFLTILLWLCISVRANEVRVAFVNGAPQGILWHDKDNWTMYVSPYMVVNADRFTKHYYVGSQRIASKIGAGEFNNLYDASKACVTAGQKDYAERMNLITQSRNDYYVALGIPPVPPTAKGIYGEAEYSGMYGDYVIEPLGDYSVPTGWPMKPYKRPYGGTPGPPVMYEKPSDPEDEGAGYGYSNGMSQQERDVFYYHSDHLGSTSYITDRDGNATQFVCYKPYGEALVDEHNTTFEQPWKFNGKELDSETGLYYYGARYYEASLTAWYGPDKLAEDYPSIGSYVYCAGNPVRFVDVDGNDWYETEFGAMVYDKNIKSKDEFINANIQGNYLGSFGFGINSNTGSLTFYMSNGKTYNCENLLPEVTVKSEKMNSLKVFGRRLYRNYLRVGALEGHRDGLLAPVFDKKEIQGAASGVGMLVSGVLSVASFGTGATATTTIGKVLGLGEGVIGSASILFSADDMMVNRNGTAMERTFPRLHIEINMAKKATTYLSLTTGGVGVIKSFKTRSVIEGVLNSTGLISTGINCTFNEKK